MNKIVRDSYVIVKLDTGEQPDKKNALENPGASQLMKELGGEKAGFPFFVIEDPSGKKLADSNAGPGNANIGCPATKEELAAFDGILRRTAPKMTEMKRTRILDELRKVTAPQHP